MSGDRGLALGLFLLTACAYLFFQNWVPEEADTEVGFQATRALALRGELYLTADNPSTLKILTKFGPGEDAYNCHLDARTGRQYPYWGLAYVAAGVPMYWIGHVMDLTFPRSERAFSLQTFTSESIPGSEYWSRVCVMSLQPLFAAGTILCVFLAARHAGARQRAALTAALLTGFATSFAVQARSGLSDSQATFFVAWATERAFAARRSGRLRHAALIGVAAGLAFLTKLHTAFALAPVPLVLLGAVAPGRKHVKLLLTCAAAAVPFLLTFFAANYLRWGNPWTTGYEKSTAQEWFKISVFQGLTALVFSPSKGVAVYAFAIALPAVWGVVRGFRSHAVRQLLTGVLVLSVVGALAMPASTIEWHGSWAFGPRYALLAFPALGILTALSIDSLGGRFQFAAPILGLLGFATILPGMLTSPFGAIAVSMEGARVEWPSDGGSFPSHYSEADRDAERFQRLCLTAGPLNFLRVQHALAFAAFMGRQGLRYREDLGLDKPGEALPPAQFEYRRFNGVGWVGYVARFAAWWILAYPAFLLVTGAASAGFLVMGLRRQWDYEP